MARQKSVRAKTRVKTEKPVRDVEIAHPSYQPSKAEMEVDMRVNASFEDAVKALARPVRMRYVEKPSS